MFTFSPTIVLPRSFRQQVLELTHDRMGHLGHRKCLTVIKRRFTWPLLARDVQQHCALCVLCQQFSKSSLRKAPMVEGLVLSEPYEQVAFDLVDPFPKAKGGLKYILTYGCMASRWIEATLLRNITAKFNAQML